MPEYEEWDVIGIGCGPSNLALAAAIDDANRRGTAPIRALFLESQTSCVWHPEVLLPDADCQVSYLKDLATQRDPTSPYTFLNYLKSQGRLNEFIDLGETVPSRHDFTNYFAWVASKLALAIRCETTVTQVQPRLDGGRVVSFEVSAVCRGERLRLRAPQVVVAVGGRPKVPEEFLALEGPRCFHTARFLSSFERAVPSRTQAVRVALIGGGQSAVDVATYLLSQYQRATVDVFLRGYSLRTADENPFLNKFFTAHNADIVHALPAASRAALADEYFDTGVAVADRRLVQKLYAFMYRERSQGKERLRFHNFRSVIAARVAEDQVTLTTRHRFQEGVQQHHADVVVLATGFDRSLRGSLLGDVERYLFPGPAMYPDLLRDYSAASLKDAPATLYLQGYAAYTHGVGEESLGLVATRAADVLGAIQKRLSSARTTGPVDQGARTHEH